MNFRVTKDVNQNDIDEIHEMLKLYNVNKQMTEFILCPVCKNKTRLKMREDTELKNFPLFCPKCKQETLISVKQLKIEIHKEPDAKTQSQ